MRSIFEPNASQVIKLRISRLRPDSERQWGKMNAAQAVAHLSKGIEQALGDVLPPRLLMGRLIGGYVKSEALSDDPRHSVTTPHETKFSNSAWLRRAGWDHLRSRARHAGL